MNPGDMYIFDVDAEEFEQKVIQASHEHVIVVDFWASWCGPCKILGPLLESIVSSFDGRVRLAKVDVDRNRELALRFNVQNIPTVKIFSRGAIADEFVGVLPEHEITAILSAIAGGEHDDILLQAEAHEAAGSLSEAEMLYSSILEEEPDNSAARIGLARVLLRNGGVERASELLTGIGEYDERYNEAKALLGTLDFIEVCRIAGDRETWRKKVSENPDDLEALYTLGCCYAAGKQYGDALETFLFIVKRNSEFGEGKARKAMLTLFTVLGQDHELTVHYRDMLARALF